MKFTTDKRNRNKLLGSCKKIESVGKRAEEEGKINTYIVLKSLSFKSLQTETVCRELCFMLLQP